MSTPNLNILLSAYLPTYDNLVANTPLLCRPDAQNPNYGAVAYSYQEYLQAPVGSISVPLPQTNCYVAWIRNRNASAGSVGITINYNVAGSSQCFLGQNGVFIYFDVAKANGFTSLSLTGIGGTIPCEVFVAG